MKYLPCSDAHGGKTLLTVMKPKFNSREVHFRIGLVIGSVQKCYLVIESDKFGFRRPTLSTVDGFLDIKIPAEKLQRLNLLFPWPLFSPRSPRRVQWLIFC